MSVRAYKKEDRMKVKFSEWKTKWIKHRVKGLSTTYLDKEKVKFRSIKINDFRIEEGIILEHLSKTKEEKDYFPSQQHLIGYHYFSLIDKYNKDVFWFQGNIKGRVYRFFYTNDVANGLFKDFKSYKSAVEEFNKLLKERFGIEIEVNKKPVIKEIKK